MRKNSLASGRYARFLKRSLIPLVLLALTLPLLSSCYIPDNFVCEIRVARTGDWALIYRGDLIWAPLAEEAKTGKKTPKQIAVEQKALLADLHAAKGFKSIQPEGPGRFKVDFEQDGRFTAPRQVMFPRPGAAIMAMELKQDGTLHIWANTIPKTTDIAKLNAANITSHGRMRVITDLKVLKTNASPAGIPLPGYPGWRIFDWTIVGLGQTPPVLVARMFPPEHMKPIPKF